MWPACAALCFALAALLAAGRVVPRLSGRAAPGALVSALGGRFLSVLPRRYGLWLEGAIRRAGREEETRPERIVGVQAVAVVAGCASALPLGATAAASLACAGACLPLLRLRDAWRRRELEIFRALPWTLDLLALAVEVGVDFNVALGRVVDASRPGPLRDELALALRELRLGSTRAEALDGVRRRNRVPALQRFCTSVIQADRLGTPLASVLRDQAADLRMARAQLAEKRAGEAPVKLLMPLLACIFPTVFLVLLGPIAFSMLYGGNLP